jgi:CBS domain containing-hemolysin-like protein
MPESDASGRGDAADHQSERRNLPVPVPQPPLPGPENGNGWLTRLVRMIFGWRTGSIRSDLKAMLEAPPGETGISLAESVMLKNILGLRERKIENVMVPRADIVAVQQDIALGELLRVFERAEHSRLVAYNDSLDDPVGMVHIRDLIAFMVSQAAVDPKKNVRRKKPLPAALDLKAIDLSRPLSSTRIVREILFVPPSMPVNDLLAKMQATRIHLALVIDEYGGTDGLVSIEDLVEEVVGEIADEHDVEDEPLIRTDPRLGLIADARMPVEELEQHLGIELVEGEQEEDIDTLGGLVFSIAGRIPARGELVLHPSGVEFEVLEADPRRIKKLRIHVPRQAGEAEAGAAKPESQST